MFYKIKQKLMHYTWDIAYGAYTDEILTNGLKNIHFNIIKNPYPNKWFADPFILEEDENRIQFLVEEFDYSVDRGRIARIVVEKKDNEIKECSIILDLPTHLSFPAIYRCDGNIYVHPENSASGRSFIYLYDKKIDKLINPQLIIDEPITDAIIKKTGDFYCMFATKVPVPNGGELHEYRSANLVGQYKHVSSEIYEKNTARMAGKFMETDLGVIRPAQDCFGDYGKAVILYDGHRTLCRIAPTSYKYAGIHTFNAHKGTFVFDLKKYDHPIIYKIIRTLKK